WAGPRDLPVGDQPGAQPNERAGGRDEKGRRADRSGGGSHLPSIGRNLRQLGESHTVAGRITEPAVDAVRHLMWLLGELDAAGLELFVAGLAVLGDEEDSACEALRGEVQH